MKALALLSGGLDSFLAAKLIQEQGIEAIGLSFRSPFFGCEGGRKTAALAGIPFHCVDFTEKFLPVLVKPRYGYGKHLNPCIDCHQLMVAEAFSRMETLGASFVVTGEVLGQRPKSQHLDALNSVAKAGKPGLLLRPLSARLLKETIPEKEGWVDRSRFLDISGRSRKTQLGLARKYGAEEHFSPGGGCLLTDPEYCRRLEEIKDKEGWLPDHLALLRVGRHFRLPAVSGFAFGAKVVSGRNEEENAELERLAREGDVLFQAVERPASVTLLRKASVPFSREEMETAASITARYSRAAPGTALAIGFWKPSLPAERETLAVPPLPDASLAELRI